MYTQYALTKIPLNLYQYTKISKTRVETSNQYNKNNLKFVSIYKNPYQCKIFKASSCLFGLKVDSIIYPFVLSFLYSPLFLFKTRSLNLLFSAFPLTITNNNL